MANLVFFKIKELTYKYQCIICKKIYYIIRDVIFSLWPLLVALLLLLELVFDYDNKFILEKL